jgi:hypothetical protein
MTQAVGKGFDEYLLTPDFFADPYPFYHQLRSTQPVYWSDRLGAWLLTRYTDVASALHDSRLKSGSRIQAIMSQLPETVRSETQPLYQHLTKMMAFTDPPNHTRLRTLVGKAFTPGTVAKLRPRIQAIVDELLDKVQGTGKADLVRDFAYPLPAIVICEMLGIPLEVRDHFKQWSNDIVGFVSAGQVTAHKALTAQRSVAALTEYFLSLCEQRRQHPREDLISALVIAEEEGDKLTEDELLSMCVQLFFAGFETTEGLIGNGLLALMRNPDQLKNLRDNPSLIGTAVEEFLRYDNSVQRQARVASVDLEIGGQRILQGQYLLLFIGAANRDPAQFRDPDRLDISRCENKHVAFGHGIHFCIGAPLARLEGEIAINTVLGRFPGLRLMSQSLAWEELLALRKLKSLKVSF